MKSQLFKSIAAVAACAVAMAALPADAADQPSGSTVKSRDSRGSSEMAKGSSATQDRRIDFGKPVRFVRNTFSREDDQNDRNPEAKRNRSDDSRAEGRASQREPERPTRLSRQEEEREQNRFWNRGQDRDDDKEMKKEEKQGLISRLLNWRPFSRDRDG